MELLWNAGADLLLIETQPSLEEALVEAELAEGLGADYWISFSCRDGRHIHEGNLLRDCAAALSAGHPHLKMIGVNCTKPEYIGELIGEYALDYFRLGADAVGGCCTTVETHIREVVSARERYLKERGK